MLRGCCRCQLGGALVYTACVLPAARLLVPSPFDWWRTQRRRNNTGNFVEKIFIFASEQWLLVSLLFALVIAYFWTEGRKGGATLSIHSATRLINKGEAVVVDLREAKEYQAGHIVDALSIPHNKLAEQLPLLDSHKDKTLILVDKMGQHAGAAGRLLKTKGFTVSRLQGGISEWQAQNLPLVKGK
jgi:rhodanese-related sulfurtransferase